jgi:hypothetical protein
MLTLHLHHAPGFIADQGYRLRQTNKAHVLFLCSQLILEAA